MLRFVPYKVILTTISRKRRLNKIKYHWKIRQVNIYKQYSRKTSDLSDILLNNLIYIMVLHLSKSAIMKGFKI